MSASRRYIELMLKQGMHSLYIPYSPPLFLRVVHAKTAEHDLRDEKLSLLVGGNVGVVEERENVSSSPTSNLSPSMVGLSIANHTDDVVDYLNTNYTTCLALVFLSSDLQDRTMGSAAAKSILAAAGVPGAENLAIIYH
ncbi:hypothetical protein R3P38DRAFT_3204617 [Favolaschia claudopus]|uniref:Uncharacterized protein n=1 Tax=Favolaschia claudopus TaxID=2862362 RepID=A0AAW0AQS9_9AGAR